MRPDWKKITAASDPAYDGSNPRYEAEWYGSEPAPTIGPSGQHDAAGWTISLDESAPVAHSASGKRWLAQRSTPPAPDCPELDAAPVA